MVRSIVLNSPMSCLMIADSLFPDHGASDDEGRKEDLSAFF
jgi:hypothetical protein